jgi:hypothetical protein
VLKNNLRNEALNQLLRFEELFSLMIEVLLMKKAEVKIKEVTSKFLAPCFIVLRDSSFVGVTKFLVLKLISDIDKD